MDKNSISFLPSPIAAPLALATPSNPQRKDMLRFALENTVSLIGAIAVGDLLDLVAGLEEEAEEGNTEETKEGFLATIAPDAAGEL